jgi:hypothetical protein
LIREAGTSKQGETLSSSEVMAAKGEAVGAFAFALVLVVYAENLRSQSLLRAIGLRATHRKV